MLVTVGLFSLCIRPFLTLPHTSGATNSRAAWEGCGGQQAHSAQEVGGGEEEDFMEGGREG
jgi:hypothetical protein